ncbi:MAG: FecR family protein [Segetibacter sp.]|nr:FecR family protein [Segetibacter sp.]
MGNSNYFDELIVSYLSNELNAEEESFVLDWINSSEQNKQYFEELRSTWNLLAVEQTVKDINIEAEWNQFKQAIGTSQKAPSFIEPASFDTEVIEEVKPNRKAKVYKLFVSIAVAASILVVIALGWRLANYNAIVEKPLAVNVNKEIPEKPSSIRTRFNTTDKPIVLVLQDGSEVKLYGKSKISYEEPFTGNKRDISLVGKANFKVAKDKTKPFTVFSGDLATTALGTQFTVTAFKNGKNIIVRLYEGKVVVKSSASAKRKFRNDYYLLPGHELVYDNQSLTATIRTFRIEVNLVTKNNNKKETVPIDNPSVPKLGNGTWYMFNNQPLPQVLDQLEGMFNVDIVYSKKDLSKIYFIGTFNIADSLDDILKQIADLNDLKVIKKNNKIIISK